MLPARCANVPGPACAILAFRIEGLAEYELIAYRQYMVAAGRRPATVNRRLDALRRLCRWAHGTGALTADAARDVRPMRTARNQQPVGLTDIEVHALLRLHASARLRLTGAEPAAR
jgi:site-specific recombinase XerD